jgi:PAS domain S-box-containing protein
MKMWLSIIELRNNILLFCGLLFTPALVINANAWQKQDALPNSQYVYQVWNNKNGLPRNAVFATAEDDKEYISIAAEGDLRFDGYELDKFGNWSEASALSFAVKPSFYQTSWFKAILFGLLLTIIFFILKYYSKYQQETRLKALVDKRTKELKESNERLRYVIQATNEAIWEYDITSNRLIWGEGYNVIFGHKTEIITDISEWSKLIHPDDMQRVWQGLDTFINSTQNHWSDEYRYLKANGEYAQVQDKAIIIRARNGKAIRMIGAMQDVTNQKEAEQHRRLLESVVTHANDGVIITDASPPHHIVFVNEAMTRITGYSKKELIGNGISILHGPETDDKELDRLSSALKKGEPCEIEVLEYKKSGEKIWINISMAPVLNEKEQITHWISTERDVTERKEHMKAIEDQNLKLKAIAWTQSHIVRAPLAKMIGYIDLIENYDISRLDINVLLNHIKDSGVELDSIIKDIVNKTEIVKRDLMDE